MPSGHYKNSTVTMESSDGGDSMENYNGDHHHHMMDTKNGNNDHHNQNNTKPMTSFDPIEYVQRTRITKPVFAKPAADPLQFIKVKPCNLYQTAQEQLKKAEEVKKVKEIKKEEPEDWQSNLDNWKSSRRKRVEHIIDRVVEVKKFEMDEFDRTRRKSKTFSEMLEERGTRGTKVTLPVYAEDDANDLTDLGIGTSSTSCKSSVSEDFDNHSVVSDSQESTNDSSNNKDHHHHHMNGNNSDYDNPSSPINTSEYTYEGAIQGYKTRISNKFQNTNFGSNKIQTAALPESNNTSTEKFYNFNNRFTSSGDKFIKTQEKFFSNNNNTFELENHNNNNHHNNDINVNLPKIDISKKKELFENRTNSIVTTAIEPTVTKISSKVSEEFSNAKSIKERLSTFGRKDIPDVAQTKENTVKVDGEQVVSLKDRLSNFEKQIVTEKPTSVVPSKIDVPIVSLKDRLYSLQSNISPDGKPNHNKEVDEKLERTNNSDTNRCVVFEMNNRATTNHVIEPVVVMPKEIKKEPKIEPEHKKVEYFHERNEVKLVINEEPSCPVVDELQTTVEDEIASNQAVDEHEISVLGSGNKDLVADCNVKSNSSIITKLTSSHNHSLIENIAELCEKVEHCETHKKPNPILIQGLPIVIDMDHKIPSLPTSPIKNIELNTTKNFNSMLTFMRHNISSAQQHDEKQPPTIPPPPAPIACNATTTDDEIILNANLRKLDDVLNSIEHLHISGVDEILDEELNKLDLEIN